MDKLIEALADELAWHEGELKALSKQPPTPALEWPKHQHRERIDAITAALASAKVEPVAPPRTAEQERAEICNWLRSGAGMNTQNLDRASKILFLRGLHSYADAIERGAHVGAAHDPS